MVDRLLKSLLFMMVFFTVLLLFRPLEVFSQRPEMLEASDVIILFDPGLGREAENVVEIYALIKTKTQNIFGWSYNRKPFVVLINERERFLQTADHPITIAYAVPDRNLIVIDYSKVSTSPFSLETTLIHEFCHLLLHDHIPHIPRWLDEGLCQWASGGFDEIIFNMRQSALNQASMTGNFIPLAALGSAFPRSEHARILAYEQSKSFINYLVRIFGEEKLLELLDRIAHGEMIQEAFHEVYGTGFDQLEISWQDSIRKDLTWFTYLGNHIYELLFVGGAILSVLGFFRLIRKKRQYKDEDFDE